MVAQPSVQEVLAKIRERVGARVPRPSPSKAERPEATAAPQPAYFDLGDLKRSLHDCDQLYGAVGSLNPRNPGLHNQFIQFVKKVMRRSLSWYTRPLHQFHAAVTRTLIETTKALDNAQVNIIQLREDSRQLREDSLREVLQLRSEKASLEALKQQEASLEELQRQQEASLEALRRRQEESLEALRQRFSEANIAVEAKLNLALSDYRHQVEHMNGQVGHMTGQIEAFRSELHRTGNEVHEVVSKIRVRDRDLRRLFHAAESSTIAPSSTSEALVPAMFPSDIKSDVEFDYFVFEDLYRGDEAVIGNRQKEYVPYFRGRENVVDIGCGRGEFLELLRDNGVNAYGVESGMDQCLLCREKGLEIVQQDLFTHLESLPDESLGGIFSAQVIEHMSASDQLRYVRLAYHKTKPGSPVIFETINAQCVYAVMRNFFLDPTHVRPIHPETLKFAMESMRFRNVALRFSSPASDKWIPPLKLNGDTPQLAEFNRSIEELNNLIYGYQDYAAIGWR